MKIKLWRSFVLILAAGWFASAAPSQEVTPRKIRVLTLLGRPLQITVAETQGCLAKYGVAVETDNSSSSSDRLAKLGPPGTILPKRSGLVSLGSVQDLIGPYQAAGNWAQRKWAQEHRDPLVGYLAAFIEAQRWLTEPGNRDQVIALLMKESHLPADVAAETYILSMTRPGGYEKDPRLDLHGFTHVLKLRTEIEGPCGGHPPAPGKNYDASYFYTPPAQPK